MIYNTPGGILILSLGSPGIPGIPGAPWDPWGAQGVNKPAKYILKNKSGTNEHPIKPFDARICGIFSRQLPPGFFTFKPCNYGLQMEVKK